MKLITKSTLLSLSVIILISVFEQLISGNGIEWFKTLNKPPILVSLNVFYVVVGILSIINLIVLTRLFLIYFETKSKTSRNSIIWIIILLLANAIWNYFFMGLENVEYGFWGMLLFLPVVVVVLFHLFKTDKLSFYLYSIYLVWVIYDIIWTYQLWKLN